MPFLRQWKSNQLLQLSKVYQDESISNETNLLEDGIRKARIANLLDPQNLETRENFFKLLFRSKPTEALQKWANILHFEEATEEKRTVLLDRSIKTLKNDLGEHNQFYILNGGLSTITNCIATDFLAKTIKTNTRSPHFISSMHKLHSPDSKFSSITSTNP